MLETNQLTSNPYLTLNNAFGYGGEGNLKKYSSVFLSVLDLVKWLIRHDIELTGQTPLTYAVQLKSAGYYTAEEIPYYLGLLRYYNQLDNE